MTVTPPAMMSVLGASRRYGSCPEPSAVVAEDLARDEARRVARQVDDKSLELVGLALPAHRRPREDRGVEARDRLRRRDGAPLGAQTRALVPARGDGVGADAVARVLRSELTREAHHAGLRRGVVRSRAGEARI